MTRLPRFRRPAPADPIGDTAQLLAALVKTRNENAALVQQLRDTARERDRLQLEARSAATMLAAAKRQCAAGCEHAQAAARKDVQLAAMQTRLDEDQARQLAAESAGFAPRAERPAVLGVQAVMRAAKVPKQRRGGTT